MQNNVEQVSYSVYPYVVTRIVVQMRDEIMACRNVENVGERCVYADGCNAETRRQEKAEEPKKMYEVYDDDSTNELRERTTYETTFFACVYVEGAMDIQYETLVYEKVPKCDVRDKKNQTESSEVLRKRMRCGCGNVWS